LNIEEINETSVKLLDIAITIALYKQFEAVGLNTELVVNEFYDISERNCEFRTSQALCKESSEENILGRKFLLACSIDRCPLFKRYRGFIKKLLKLE